MTETVKVKKLRVEKHKCVFCKKKLSTLMCQISCECGNTYCTLHRLPENHDCSVDRRAKHMQTSSSQIEKMKCVNDKIVKI